MAVDEALLRMRRSLEWTGIISRSAAVLWIAATVLLLPGMHGVALGVNCATAAAEVALSLVSVVALRNAGHRRYPRLSAAILAADTAALIAMVGSAAREPQLVFWPMLVIPIIAAAYRHRMAGALAVALATAGGGALLYFLAPRLYGHRLPNDLVTVAPGLELMVAVMTGLLARVHHNHLGQLAAARARLREQALHDPLTGLANRHLLHEHARAALRPGQTASVLVLDLDGFKAVNDSLGHAAGDELLRAVAGRLRAEIREGDLAARLGGDEFVVVLHDTDAAGARDVAGRLRAAVAEPVPLTARTVRVGASIGTATARDGDLDGLLRSADAEMYRAKAAHHARAAPVSRPGPPRARAAT